MKDVMILAKWYSFGSTLENRYGTEGRTLEQHFYSIMNFTVK